MFVASHSGAGVEIIACKIDRRAQVPVGRSERQEHKEDLDCKIFLAQTRIK